MSGFIELSPQPDISSAPEFFSDNSTEYHLEIRIMPLEEPKMVFECPEN